MQAARSRQAETDVSTGNASPQPTVDTAVGIATPATGRLAESAVVPTPSPVHRMQAELAQRTAPQDAQNAQNAQDAQYAPDVQVYPGWLRLIFPVATSALLWVAIIKGLLG